MDVLKPGQRVVSGATGLSCHVGPLLGAGGQGEVYRASLGGRTVALKWYFKRTATDEQRRSLARLVQQGPPDHRFLWPEELLSQKGVAGFGYVMPLREPRYKSIVELMKGRVDPGFRALCTAGFQLADSFLQLHSRGLCYRDISFGNVFFEPDAGDVLICDNDNVGVDGRATAGVLGTPRFMAPEVVRGDAAPSTATDLWSLSVLLFYMLLVHHPLEGKRELAIKCLDLPAMTRLFGTHPLFVFDPADRSNAAVPGYHDNVLAYWGVYPSFLKDLFTRAFTAGIRDPLGGRVRESEWRGAMLRLRDSLCYCQRCGAECFLGVGPCWSCRASIVAPFQLSIGGHHVVLNHDSQLFPHHIDDARLYDLSAPVAGVTRHPQRPDVWGLRNLSSTGWTATRADGTLLDVPAGRSVTLATGTRIRFGSSEGEVHSA